MIVGSLTEDQSTVPGPQTASMGIPAFSLTAAKHVDFLISPYVSDWLPGGRTF